MSRHYFLSVSRLPGRRFFGWGALVLAMWLAGCGVSAKHRIEMSKAVNTFVSQWKQADLNGIYRNADPQFRRTQTLADWQAWAATIQEDRGRLQSVEILGIDRISPTAELYTVETVMKYESGNTRGRFTFSIPQDKPRLVAVILANVEKERS